MAFLGCAARYTVFRVPTLDSEVGGGRETPNNEAREWDHDH